VTGVCAWVWWDACWGTPYVMLHQVRAHQKPNARLGRGRGRQPLSLLVEAHDSIISVSSRSWCQARRGETQYRRVSPKILPPTNHWYNVFSSFMGERPSRRGPL
jgi:hypothetical protein